MPAETEDSTIACLRARWQEVDPDLDTSSMEIVGPLKRAQALLDIALEPFFATAGVSSAELDVLLKLRHAEQPVIARQLAEQMGLSRAGVSKGLSKLERRGLVAREANPTDRRAALLQLTPEGEQLVDTVFPGQLAREAELLAGLDDDARATVVAGLNTLVTTLERAAHREP